MGRGTVPSGTAPGGVHDLIQLGLDVLDVVVLRMPGMGDIPVERSLAEPLEALVELQQ